MNRRKDKVFVMLFVSIMLSVVCGVITYLSMHQRREAQQVVLNTYVTINSSEKLLSLLKDMESGHRGYILTGDSSFLAPFEESRKLIPEEIKALRGAVANNEQQVRFLNKRILPALENRSNASVHTILMHNSAGVDTTQRLAVLRIGKAYMDTIRVLMASFEQNEYTSLASHERQLARTMRIEDIIQLSSFALIAITCTLAFVRLSREVRNISELVVKLERANETLEEKVQLRTQQLTEANEAKDHFIGIASHDLKSPLAGVQGLIQLMRLENKDRDAADLSYMNYMDDACKSMMALITNLLDTNRIDRGMMPFEKANVSVRNILNRIRQNFLSQATNKNIPLEVSDVDATIHTDPGVLIRILENLVSNALKFSSAGQPVRVTVSHSNDHILFAVEDHGPGISEDELPKLFRKFSRLSNRSTAGESSSGLGLAIVKELTDRAGGTISVSSSIGKGSVFTVRLPVA